MSFPVTQYRLANGLTLLLSPHDAEPRIHTQIVVRAGSKNDPARSTGLAHYLEHMLFKGTASIGTSNWEAEEPLLRQIADTYEAHRATSDPEERVRLYARIDELSQQAAAYALPGEYDRILSQLGARNTNAYTSNDQTVFINNIPSNELERWMVLEAERFSRLVLRLFHTELETVFEEFNISQDRDIRKVLHATDRALFSPHPYGTQTTLGEGEHLKAPSHHDIYEFFARHYVPGNMAVVMAGDFDPAEVLRLAEATFGRWEARPVPQVELPPAAAASPQTLEVYGESAAALHLSWPLGPAAGREALVADLTARLLKNGHAGLIDTKLLQPQKLLSADTGIVRRVEYGTFIILSTPGDFTSLEEARDLLLAQVKALANNDFPDWLLEGVVNNYELDFIRGTEENSVRVDLLTRAFVQELPLERVVNSVAEYRSITRAEVVDFVRKVLSPQRLTTVYKRQGSDPNVLKVDKPPITPVPLHTDGTSAFARDLLAMRVPELNPVFADLDAVVHTTSYENGNALHSVHNEENELAELSLIYPYGEQHHRWLPYAAEYLEIAATATRSQQELRADFFRLGVRPSISCKAREFVITLRGLAKNIEHGLELLRTQLATVVADQNAWERLVDSMEQLRQYERSDKKTILQSAMQQYGCYGETGLMYQRPTLSELRAQRAGIIADYLHRLAATSHTLFYYGPEDWPTVQQRFGADLAAAPQTAGIPSDRPAPQPQHPTEDRVFFVHFPMVQAEVLALRFVTDSFDQELWTSGQWFNEYYGYGLSSVVFQELRESRALAYSTFAMLTRPARPDDPVWLKAFIGTQPDKLDEALAAMRLLLHDWQYSDVAAEQVRQGMLHKMRTIRHRRTRPYQLYRQAQHLGLSKNPDQLFFDTLSQQSVTELERSFALASRQPTTYLVIGDRERVDLKQFAAFGNLQELSLDEVFGEQL